MAHEIEVKVRVADLERFRAALRRVGARVVGGGTGRVHEWNTLYDTVAEELRGRDELLRIRVETRTGRDGRRLKKAERRVILTFKRPVGEGGREGRPVVARGLNRPTYSATGAENLGRSTRDVGPSGAAVDRSGGDHRDDLRRHKVREEMETEVGDAKELRRILAGLGMRESFHYEKYRTTFRMPAQRWAARLLIELDETPIGTFVELEGPAKAIDRAARALGFSKKEYIVANYLRLYAEECMRRGEKIGEMVFRNRT
ncbi:MAG: class IV adenylate cyclase [Candidatus Acidiferrum sp.]|jgi:adenylate cyclase class IV